MIFCAVPIKLPNSFLVNAEAGAKSIISPSARALQAGFGFMRTEERVASMDIWPGKPGARFIGIDFLAGRKGFENSMVDCLGETNRSKLILQASSFD